MCEYYTHASIYMYMPFVSQLFQAELKSGEEDKGVHTLEEALDIAEKWYVYIYIYVHYTCGRQVRKGQGLLTYS